MRETAADTDKCCNFAEYKIVNVMEKFFKVLMMLAICISPSAAVSQTPASTSSEIGNETRAKLRLTSRNPDGKRCPSNVYIEVSYINGCISVSSTIQDEIVTLTIEDSATGESEILYSLTPGEYVPVMLDAGCYFLSLELSDGRIFCGYVYIE